MCNECCSILKIISGRVMLNISAWLCVNLLNSLTTMPIFPLVLQTVDKKGCAYIQNAYHIGFNGAKRSRPLLYYLKLGIG